MVRLPPAESSTVDPCCLPNDPVSEEMGSKRSIMSVVSVTLPLPEMRWPPAVAIPCAAKLMPG